MNFALDYDDRYADLLGDDEPVPASALIEQLEEELSATRPLTDKDEAFCLSLVTNRSLLDAYTIAFYDGKPPATPRARDRRRGRAYRLRDRANVQARLRQLRAGLASIALVTEAEILAELQKIAMFDIRKMYDATGNLKPIDELDDSTAAGVTGLELKVDEVDLHYVMTDVNGELVQQERVTTTRTAKVKLADKHNALVSLGKAIGMFPNKLEHTGAGGSALIPEQASLVETARRVAFMLRAGMVGVTVENEAVNG